RRPESTGYGVPLRVRPERVVLRVGRRRPPGARRQGALIPRRFGESSPFSVGVEEELMILDAETFAQVAGVERILRRADRVELPGKLKTELFASIVETNTAVCPGVAEVEKALPVLRSAAGEAAAAEGLVLAAAATHPFAEPLEQPIVQEERFLTF